MDTTTIPAGVQLAAAGVVTPTVRIAIAMATHLDEIRSIYGDEAANFIIGTLRESPDPRWEEVIYNALKRWTSEHPRMFNDLNS